VVLAGIGLELRPVNGHMAQFHQARFIAQPQHLREQLRQCLQVLLPKTGNRVVIRMLVRRKVSKRKVFVSGALDSPRTHDA
jgi:hypothetical protein